VSARLFADLARGPFAFRDRAISDLEPSRLIEVEIRDGGRSWLLGRAGADWLLSEETPLLADKDLNSVLVQGFVQLLGQDFRVKEFLPDLKDYVAHDLELESPRSAAICLRFDGQPSRLRKLVLGKAAEGSSPRTYYARVDVQGVPPFLLEEETANVFRGLVAHLREVTGG